MVPKASSLERPTRKTAMKPMSMNRLIAFFAATVLLSSSTFAQEIAISNTTLET